METKYFFWGFFVLMVVVGVIASLLPSVDLNHQDGVKHDEESAGDKDKKKKRINFGLSSYLPPLLLVLIYAVFMYTMAPELWPDVWHRFYGNQKLFWGSHAVVLGVWLWKSAGHTYHKSSNVVAIIMIVVVLVLSKIIHWNSIF